MSRSSGSAGRSGRRWPRRSSWPATGIDAEVIDPRTLAPLDTATILQSVEKTGRLVVVDQATRHGSAAAVIAAEVASEGFSSLKAPDRARDGARRDDPVQRADGAVPHADEAKIVAAVQQALGALVAA